VVCGSSPAAANIPGGAIALQTSAGGPVSTILKAAGETRTHSMIAHGNGYVTHSTMRQPVKASSFSCSAPINSNALQYGYPGMEQINMGALYAFTYGTSGPGSGQIGSNSSTVEFFYQRGNGDASNRGQAAANWLWSNAPYWSIGNGSYRLGFPANNTASVYSLYQYRDMQNINGGAVPSWNGSVCSTTLAWAQYMSGNGKVDNQNTYSHTVVSNALNALHDVVYNSCNSGLGFWDSVLSSTFGAISCTRWSSSCTTILGVKTCLPEAPSVCTLAADQVSNCFATGQCATSDFNVWQGVRNNSGTTATSVSPDNIGGWANHGWGTAAPYSVWSWDNPNAVYWNSPGNVYGCW
jgi:hypothetical protein